MLQWLPNNIYEQDRSKAVEHMAQCLHDGTLALLIGAGASAGLGLPTWKELVEDCAKACSIPYDANDLSTNAGIVSLTSRIERECKDARTFIEKVHATLYRNSRSAQRDFLRQELLLALGSMVMKSRRGSIRDVITFNFDDVLERYMRIHGFSVQVVYNIPTLIRDDDVTVYHPHGFVPLERGVSQSSDFLIFSKNSFDERLGDALNGWTQLTIDTLTRKVGLFVGLSVEGPNFGPAMQQVKNRIKDTRPTGFWFVRDSEAERIEQLRDWRAVPIVVKEYQEIPEILFAICQSALKFVS